jgi:hypothetical protein
MDQVLVQPKVDAHGLVVLRLLYRQMQTQTGLIQVEFIQFYTQEVRAQLLFRDNQVSQFSNTQRLAF